MMRIPRHQETQQYNKLTYNQILRIVIDKYFYDF